MIEPLRDKAVDKANEMHPGNIHLGNVDFQVNDNGSIWFTLRLLYRADTMKEVMPESFGSWCDMGWLKRIEQIFKNSMALGDKIKITCITDSYYWEDSK